MENLRIQANQQCVEYANQFEQEARDLSVKYADGSLAKDVIEWVSDGFCRTIDAADRRPHDETISVPLCSLFLPTKSLVIWEHMTLK